MIDVYVSSLRFENVDILRRGTYRILFRICRNQYIRDGLKQRRDYIPLTIGDSTNVVHVGSSFEIKCERQIIHWTDETFKFTLTNAHPHSEDYLIKIFLEFCPPGTPGQFITTSKKRICIDPLEITPIQRVVFGGSAESRLFLILRRTIAVSRSINWGEERRNQSRTNVFRVHTHENFRGVGMDFRQYPTDNDDFLQASIENIRSKASLNSAEYQSLAASECSSRKFHLIVCVSGLEGTHHDFRKFRNIFQLDTQDRPDIKTVWHLSAANDAQTFDDIELQARRLVTEILAFVENWRNGQGESEFWLSIAAFSLGGLVSRCAFAHHDLRQFDRNFYAFLSIATPHLGLYFNTNQILDILMKSAVALGSKAIEQLLATDHANPRMTFLYQLAQRDCLFKFKRLIFVASSQDMYVPCHSALLEIDKRALSNPRFGNIYLESLVLIVAKLMPTPVICERLHIKFDNPDENSGSIDRYLQRGIHLRLLRDDRTIETLVNWLLPS
eukprot:Partr_v1_DN25612_c0_g1_i2_m4546 putative family with sequence similarity 135, member